MEDRRQITPLEYDGKQKPAYLEFYIQWNYPSKIQENKYLYRFKKSWTYSAYQHTSNASDTKGSSLYWRKIFQKVSTELQESMKRPGSG